MEITSRTKEVYVPASYGNRDLPKNQQMTALLDHPTTEEREKYIGARGVLDTTALIKDRVKFRNLIFDGENVESGEDLIKGAKYVDVKDLVSELALVFLNGTGIEEETEKNSGAPPS